MVAACGFLRRPWRPGLIAAVGAIALGIGFADESPRGWTPELAMKVRGVAAARVSPDGRRVAYTVSAPAMTPERSELVAQLWLANADGSDAVQLTFAEKSSSDPQWSPDGTYLAFISTRAGKANLYRIRVDGGEAEALTDAKSGVSSCEWAPDGRAIAFLMADAPSDADDRNARGRDDARWVDENVRLTRLYVVPVGADAAGRREPRRLTPGDRNVTSFDWCPDGKSIGFSHTRSPKADDWPTADVAVVDLATGQTRPLAATPAAEADPIYSPDGMQVAMTVSDDPPRWIRRVGLQVVPAGGGAPRALPPTPDELPNLVDWSADGARLYFSEARGTVTRLYSLAIGDGALSPLNGNDGVIGAISLNRGRTTFGFTRQASDRAPEAFVSPADTFRPARVSRANADLPDLPIGKTEVVRWQGGDGMEIEGLLTYPVGYQAGQRVPLLLVIHGGPSGVFQQTFLAGPGLYPLAAFAARGYAVLRPNPRGSSGYGYRFRAANFRDWGGGDYRDLMAGVDHLVGMGVADPERLGVMGWSYGGYMTSWIITQTRRFKAASIGAPVTNLVSFTGTADIPSFLPSYFGAQYWEAFDLYREHSPVAQAKGVTTPTLIQHGEADERVPIGQGYELYNVLKAQGVPVRMLTLPRQPHGPSEPKMLVRVMQSNLDWFEKYVKP